MRSLYFDPGKAGHGLGVHRRGGEIRAALWYAFDGRGDQCWLLLVRRSDEHRFDVYRPRDAMAGFPIGASMLNAGPAIGIATLRDQQDGTLHVQASLQTEAINPGPHFSPAPPPISEFAFTLVETPLP